MDALKIQIEYELQRFNTTTKSIETLFIGGGTPSTVKPSLYREIFELLLPYLSDDVEITSEANPNSASYEWLEGMRALGVNRISFGVQSFDAKKLKLLNRAHTPQMARDALLNAQKVGFENLSLDLIYATAGDTQELLEDDLNEAFALPINHLSAYALTIEEGTAFERKPQMAKEYLETTKWLFKAIEERGLKQYEISNFGSYQSKHNLGYWQYKDYIGAGAGAVGKLHNRRFYPQRVIESYIKNPLKIEIEELSDEDMRIEQIFLGFRSCIGVDKAILSDEESIRALVLQEEQKISFKDGRFYNLDYLLADELTLFLTS